MLIFTGGSVWLKQWAEKNGEEGRNPNVGKYIGVYFAFGIGGAGLVVVQTLIVWIFCSIEVSDTHVHPRYETGTKILAGISKASREDGFCHFQIPNELLRNVSTCSGQLS